ncbi:imelysin family protein [Thioclava pacifica]|uniref:Imelysin-like domain-containing protein n=1 Tax=Thioclava pacifica DSM 10166 TaxID=1353537 RepID=A0A074J5F1_9RHOB|nr:imelysin family protein [Thioclava pacifica]KEO50858.1 hypothetical protein TP2_13300 [Thioclava pacifica DSM 10166]
MRLPALLLSLTLAVPAYGGVSEALEQDILPGFAHFAQSAQTLAETAEADCTAPAVRPAYNAAFDAWLGVGDLRIGPSETAALSIAFWPDDRGFTQRTVTKMVAQEDPVVDDPARFAEASIAAKGLFALEMLLYDPAFLGYDAQSYSCRYVRAASAELARQARTLAADWEAFAGVLKTAGAPENATYMSDDEAIRALYTQLLSGLEFTADSRLGRPLGTFDKPRPKLAEARRSGRSLRNVLLSAEAAERLAHALVDHDLPEVDAASDNIKKAAQSIDKKDFSDVGNPQSRLRVEILQQQVQAMRRAVETEIGTALGLSAGFNSQDGD